MGNGQSTDMDHTDDETTLSEESCRSRIGYTTSYRNRPPVNLIQPPEWPPRPDVFDEVKFGPFVSETDATTAYCIWSLPDQLLGEAWKRREVRPYLRAPQDLELDILAHNVYEHFMTDPLIPVSRDEAAENFAAEGLQQVWDTSVLLAPMKDEVIRGSTVDGVSSWELDAIKVELKRRGLSITGARDKLEQRLINDEFEGHFGIMPQSTLSHWGMNRSEKYILQPVTNKEMSPIDMYTLAIHLSPYNPTYWVSRAYCHYQQAFFDLAIGDAYRAQILCDVLEHGAEHSKQPGLYPRIWHAIEQHLLVGAREDGKLKPEIVRLRKEKGVIVFVPTLQKAAQNIISLCLAALNCWDDYVPHHSLVASKCGMMERDVQVPQLRANVTRPIADAHRESTEKQELFWHEKFQGYISAEQSYPYEDDVNRAQRSFLQQLNLDFFPSDVGGPADLSWICEARLAAKRQGLGVFATRNIKKGDLIYYEEPTIRGNLPSRRMARDKSTSDEDQPRCETCQKTVTVSSTNLPAKTKAAIEAGTDPTFCKCFEFWTRRPGTPGLVFCQASDDEDKSCLQIAREMYHFRSCGKDWRWLYDAMRPNISEYLGTEHISHTNEIHGTMLSLLLRNVFEITLRRRKDDPSLMPHELDELLVLDGGSKSWRESWFPFSMSANIIVPFDILTYLGVDIFRDLSFDTWVIQVILRKLLINVIPWDQQRRGPVPDIQPQDQDKEPEHPDDQDRRIKRKKSFTDWDPSFKNLYLFPGFSMFNHSCRGAHNADWGYDREVANRVLVWAASDIKKGDEIRLRYRYDKIESQDCAIRLFGASCQCPQCDPTPKKKNHTPQPQHSPQPQADEAKIGIQETIIMLSDESTQTSDQESEQDSPSRKRKRGEHAEVQNRRVVIHRHLVDEDDFKDLKRKQQKKKASVYYTSPPVRPDWAPLTKRRKSETERDWIEREKAAVRAARKDAYERSRRGKEDGKQ